MDQLFTEQTLFQLFMQLPCHIFWQDTHNTILGCNPAMAQFFGFNSPKDLIGKDIADIYSKDNDTKLNIDSEIVLCSGKPVIAQEYIQQANKTYCFQNYKIPLFDSNQHYMGLLSVSLDITDDKTEINYLKHIIEIMPGHVYWKNKENGGLLGCNLQMAQRLGYDSVEEVIGLNNYTILDPDLSEEKKHEIANKLFLNDKIIFSGKETYHGEERTLYQGKSEVYLSTKAPLTDLDDKVIGLIGIAQDITKYKNENELLRYILSMLPGHVWWIDREGRIEGSNQLMAIHLGYKDADALIGKTTYEMISDKLNPIERERIASKVDEINAEIMEYDRPFEGEEIGEVDNGIIKTFYSQKLPLKDLDGKIIGLAGIAQDITDLKETQRKLEVANQVKSEFIANMSHDILTPITGLLGEADYIEQHADQEEIRECGRIMREATQQLLRLSNDVIEYVSLEADHFGEPYVVFSPVEVIQNVMTLMQVSMHHKSLDFKVDVAANVPTAVRGYGQYFERIVSNLIANAIKFTHEGSIKVTLLVSEEHKEDIYLKLIVEDTGIGIPENQFDNIFKQFAKLNASYQGIYKGSGLGLFSVKQYVGQMQGHIDVESVVDQGSKFTVTIPFVRAEVAQMIELPITSPEDRQEAIILNTTPCEVTRLNTRLNKKIKILVVEDSPLPARAVMRLLADQDCEVRLVENGEDAVKEVVKKKYDLILMDIGLPGIDGVEATRQIRRLPDHYNIPIIALTGHIRGEKKSACISAGMQDVYTKPLSRNQLKTILKTYVDCQGAESQTLENIDKQILDIGAMMAHYGMANPVQTVDILTTTQEFLPGKLVMLKEAVAQNDLPNIKHIMQELKGALSYVIAPEANNLLASLVNVLSYDNLTTMSLQVMYDTVEDALQALLESINQLLILTK